MKKLILISFLIIFLFSGCASEPKESKSILADEAASVTVYITKTGECYHTEGCTCLRRSKIKRTLDVAAKRYRACQLCYPPIIEE